MPYYEDYHDDTQDFWFNGPGDDLPPSGFEGGGGGFDPTIYGWDDNYSGFWDEPPSTGPGGPGSIPGYSFDWGTGGDDWSYWDTPGGYDGGTQVPGYGMPQSGWGKVKDFLGNLSGNGGQGGNAGGSVPGYTAGKSAQGAAEGRYKESGLLLDKAALELARQRFLAELPTTRAKQSMLGDVMATRPTPATHPRANVVRFSSIPDRLSEGTREMGRGLATSAQTAQAQNPNPLGPINLPQAGFWETVNQNVGNAAGLADTVGDFWDLYNKWAKGGQQ